MSDNSSPSVRHTGEINEVLGGGGVKGYGHLGYIKSRRKRKVRVAHTFSVSAGSLVDTFDKNGFEPEETAEILRQGMGGGSPDEVGGRLRVGNGFIDMEVVTRFLVRKYNLKPHPNQSIIAYSPKKLGPVVFDYQKMIKRENGLAKAIAASCAVPGVMLPVYHEDEGLLVDGGVHHPHPAHFSDGPTIISKLGYAKHLPKGPMTPAEMWFHSLELVGAQFLDWYFPDPDADKHVLIETGMPSMACLTFSVSAAKCQDMIDHGFAAAEAALIAAIASGKVPVDP